MNLGLDRPLVPESEECGCIRENESESFPLRWPYVVSGKGLTGIERSCDRILLFVDVY